MAFLGTEWRRSSSRLDQDGRGPPPLPRASRRLAWGCSWLSRLSVSSTPLWPSVQTWVVDTDATQTKDARVHGPLTPRKPRDTRYPTPLSPSAPLLIAARVCPSFVSAGLGATSAPRFIPEPTTNTWPGLRIGCRTFAPQSAYVRCRRQVRSTTTAERLGLLGR